MPKLSLITKAQEAIKAADNIQKYIKNADNRPSKRLNGGSPPKNRPRIRIALRLFGKEANVNTGLFACQASQEAFQRLKNVLGARINNSPDSLKHAESNRGITPAKITLSVPESATGSGGTYKQSRYTGLWYPYHKKTSYTIPFGSTSDTEEFTTAASEVRAAVEGTVTQILYATVSISSEKIKT